MTPRPHPSITGVASEEPDLRFEAHCLRGVGQIRAMARKVLQGRQAGRVVGEAAGTIPTGRESQDAESTRSL